MAYEQYVDLIETTIATGINNSTTTVVVASATGMPSSGNFTILVTEGSNKELMHVTSRSGTTLTVATRGSWGTSAFSFTTAATVQLVLSAKAFDDIRANVNQVGLYSALPASGMKQGDTYRCSDVDYTFVYTGSVWQAFWRGFAVTLPPTSSWSWDNQGSSTVATSSGPLQLFTQGSASQWRVYYRSAPGTPYTLTVRGLKLPSRMVSTGSPGNMDGMGIGFRDSGGKLIPWYYLTQLTNMGWLTELWNSYSSFNTDGLNYIGNVSAGASFLVRQLEFHLRITDNGTNLIFYHSFDGVQWLQFDSRSRTAFMGSGPNGIALMLRNNSAEDSYMSVYDWTLS